MNFQDLRIGWRLLIQDPIYSSVAVFGLSFAFAACFLLLGFVRYSFDYDSQAPDRERIYAVKQIMNVMSPPLRIQYVQGTFRNIAEHSGLTESTTLVHPLDAVIRVADKSQRLAISAVDTNFQQLFDVQVLLGDLRAALAQPDAIALTAGTAQRIFGKTPALLQTVQIDGQTLRVAAIIADSPSNTNESYEALVGTHSEALPESDRGEYDKDWKKVCCKLYIKLRPEASANALENVLQDAADRYGSASHLRPELIAHLGAKKAEDIRLVALRDLYFDQDLKEHGVHGKKEFVLGLAAVAILILVLAATNYINLAIVRTLRREREIGLRKMLRASTIDIVRQFLGESILISLFATMLGLLFVWLLLPLFSNLMDRKLEAIFAPQNFAACAIFSIVIGALIGAYPAWVALKVRPAESLAGRGNHESIGGLLIRRAVTILQFTIVMGFTGLTLAIFWQTMFAYKLNPGFNARQLLTIDMPVDLSKPVAQTFRERLMHLPDVVDVAASANDPGSNLMKMTYNVKDSHGNLVGIAGQPVSPNFFDVYGVKPLAGRLFDPKVDQADDDSKVVLDWPAAKSMGFAAPEAAIGQSFTRADGKVFQIIGIAPYIRHQGIQERALPVFYRLSLDTSVLTVRTLDRLDTVENAVESIWPQSFPNDVPVIRQAQVVLEQSYADDVRLAKLLGLASLLAIVIAAFGIYAMSAYTVQRRTREIVLRKLHGASNGAIARILGREFGMLIAISALIGLPITLFANEQYLASFVERAPMGGWPLAGALLLAVFVASGATMRHTLMAIRMAPSRALTG